MTQDRELPRLAEPGEFPLDNIRQENFVYEILKGSDRTTAYKNAGFDVSNDNSAQASAARLLKSVKVQKRLSFLRRKAAEAVGITKAEVIKKLWTNAMQCMGELPVTVSKVRIKDKESGEYVVKNIEVYDRDPSAANKALELVGHEFGLFNKKIDNGNTGDYSTLPANQLMASIMEMVTKSRGYQEKLKALPVPAPVESPIVEAEGIVSRETDIMENGAQRAER